MATSKQERIESNKARVQARMLEERLTDLDKYPSEIPPNIFYYDYEADGVNAKAANGTEVAYHLLQDGRPSKDSADTFHRWILPPSYVSKEWGDLDRGQKEALMFTHTIEEFVHDESGKPVPGRDGKPLRTSNEPRDDYYPGQSREEQFQAFKEKAVGSAYTTEELTNALAKAGVEPAMIKAAADVKKLDENLDLDQKAALSTMLRQNDPKGWDELAKGQAKRVYEDLNAWMAGRQEAHGIDEVVALAHNGHRYDSVLQSNYTKRLKVETPKVDVELDTLPMAREVWTKDRGNRLAQLLTMEKGGLSSNQEKDRDALLKLYGVKGLDDIIAREPTLQEFGEKRGKDFVKELAKTLRSNTLDRVMDRVGVDRSQRDSEGHTAALDVKLGAQTVKGVYALLQEERDRVTTAMKAIDAGKPIRDSLAYAAAGMQAHR